MSYLEEKGTLSTIKVETKIKHWMYNTQDSYRKYGWDTEIVFSPTKSYCLVKKYSIEPNPLVSNRSHRSSGPKLTVESLQNGCVGVCSMN